MLEEFDLEITTQDIETAVMLRQRLSLQYLEHPNLKRSIVEPTPACIALERVTGSKWKTVGGLMLLEERAPFRIAIVPAAITPLLQQFLVTGEMEPCRLTLDFDIIKGQFSSIDMSSNQVSTALGTSAFVR